MLNNLSNRINKLEQRVPIAVRLPRVIRLLATQGHDHEADELAASEGFDPVKGDIVITRLIVTPPTVSAHYIPARILSRSTDNVR